MDKAVKDAILESISIDAEEFDDQMREITQLGSDIVDSAPPSFTIDEKVMNAKAGMTLLIQKAEELGLTGGQFIAMLIKMAVITGRQDVINDD